jgi:Ras-related protein Rab-6A
MSISLYKTYKIILIGSSSVGKTSLCHNIRGDMFNSKIPITIGVDFMKFQLSSTDKVYDIQMWDTAGHENYRSITKMYYRTSNVILVCFDLTNRKSFAELDMWMNEIKLTINHPVYICLLGLKSDLEPVVDDNDINQFLEKHLITTFHRLSSKKNDNKYIESILVNLLEKYNLILEDYTYCKEIQNGTFKLGNNNIIDDNDIKSSKKNNKSGRYCC